MDSKDNKEDKTREEADMTPSPVFPKSSKVAQNCPKVSKSDLEWPKSIFQVFLTVTHLLDVFWTALDIFAKNWAKGHVSLLPGLVLLFVLAVHSALACHSVVRTASNKY